MQKSSYRVFHTPIDLGSRLVYTDSYDTYLPVGAPDALHYHETYARSASAARDGGCGSSAAEPTRCRPATRSW